jgi:F-type H+-transporting ATPase subunit delta
MAVVTSRYARALADVVMERKLDPASTVSEVYSVVELLNGSLDLRRVWENPAVPADQKRKLLDVIVARAGLGKEVRNFLAVLIDHHRVHQLGEIARLFETELNERLGFAEAEVSSARELSAAEKRDLELQIGKLTGKRVRAKYAVNTRLLGGAVVKVGSTIYDGSVHGQLQKIREQLSS